MADGRPRRRRIRSLDEARTFYARFHDAEPEVVTIPRPDWYSGTGPLVVLGRAGELSYEPFNSSKRGTRFVHEWGDEGWRNTGHRPWVCTDGQNVYLIKVEGDYHVSPDRGIVG